MEVWNLVFMEFNRLSNGSLQPLPKKHIDTGMGLERLAMVLQGKTSNYDTDLFQPLIRQIASVSGQSYGAKDSPEDIAMRVIADHVRAIAFAIADGQLPSNTGAGYVIRRILRRAVRYAYSFLNQREAFIHGLIPVLVEVMGDKFPELDANRELMGKVIREEEEAFLRTLDRGIVRFEQYLSEHPNGKDGNKTMDGQFVFELYDTFGFPRDLTELMARERGWQVDDKGFQEQIGQQKARSRKAAKVDTGDWTVLSEEAGAGFVGYDTLEATVHIRQYRQVQAKGKSWYQLVFDQTPFYAEGGGQVGDTGFIEADGKRTFILDTKKENNLIVHRSESLPENLEAPLRAVVDAEKRKFTENNHSATHLLHRALRTVLGTHVEQRGSLVDQKHLRFDFSHFAKVDEEQLAQIEAMVNNEVRQNLALDDQREVPTEQAMAQGAMALFGEKYGDHVRVVRFGESVELCGGTHAAATGQLGLFKITSEGAVAAGIRRIEAITADQAETYVNEQLQLLKAVKLALKNPRDVEQAVTSLLDQQDKLNKRLEQLNREKAGSYKDTLLAKAETINGATFIAAKVDLEMAAIKDLAFQLRAERDDLFLLLGSESNGKGQLTLALSDKLVADKSMDAARIIRDLARSIKGGGGGQPFFATAGGKDPSGLEAAFEQARSLL
ncbi:MAG: alanine--tRNA ligase [Bacteroidota bacterium]